MRRFLKDLFVPGLKNNYRARILHPSFLALLVGFFLFNQTFIKIIALAQPGVLGYTSDITPEAIVSLTNKERQAVGLNELTPNTLLAEAAQRKAADMFAFDYWAHTSPSGRSPWDFFREVGYSYTVAGENLAKDFSDPDRVVAAWMKSATHKANIVDPRFKEIGVAVVEGELNGYQTTLVVQLFGTPTMAANPAPKEISLLKKPAVAANPAGEVAGQPKINPLQLTKGLSGFIFGIIVGAIIIDGYYVWRRKVSRLAGRNWAHAGFIAVVFFLILLSQQGVIN